MNNVVLIGMPGAGKSTIGVILAKILGYSFVDTDLIIQKKENALLKDIIARAGIDGYIEIENRINSEIDADRTVIATGGSVIYGREAMEHLRKIGKVIYIQLDYEIINKRLGNIKQRGVVLRNGQTLKDLYNERCPLYEQYAHIVVNANNLNIEELVEKIRQSII